MSLQPQISKHNFHSFLWHAGFLAFAMSFMDVDTIIPAMLVEAGGKPIHIGLMTAIMLGGSSITQLIFAPFISNYQHKKKFLLLGINLRILALLVLGLMLFYSFLLKSYNTLWIIFVLITIFSLGGAFANVSYTDIFGKSVAQESRKSFFSIKQIIAGSLFLFSAFIARYVITRNDFPVNYASMFFIGGLALFIASLGFWEIKETEPSRMRVKGIRHFLMLIKQELKQNKKLVYFLGFINTMGIAVTLLPFIMLYAKQHFASENADTGNFLVFKIAGSVATGVLLASLVKKFKYRYLLYSNVAIVAAISATLLLFTDAPPFRIIFLCGGIVFALYSISMNGVLLEVSGNENRTLYTGIAGAGNILPALFPLLAGWIISALGYPVFFLIFISVVLSSLFFIFKLNCKR